MLRALLISSIPISLTLASPAAALIIEVPYHDSTETARVTGPYAEYSPHILKLSGRQYAVLFKPGFVDAGSAIQAVLPLCAAQGRQAQGKGPVAPVDLVIEGGETRVMQGYRVVCK